MRRRTPTVSPFLQYQGLRAKTFSGKQSQRALEMIGGVATALSLAFKTADVIVDWNSPDGYNMSNATVG